MARILSLILILGACRSAPDDTDRSDGPIAPTPTGESATSDTGDQPVSEDLVVTRCQDAPTASPGADVCTIVDGDDRLLVVGDVLRYDEVFEQGSVLVEDGQITCVGCDCAGQAGGSTQVICPDAVVSPGLINAHDHVGWMNGTPWVATENDVDPDLRWEHRHDWRIPQRNHPAINERGGGASRQQKLVGEIRFLLSGATGIFGSGDTGGLLRDLDSTGSGSSGLSGPSPFYDTFPLGDNRGTQAASGCDRYQLSESRASLPGWVPHVTEGIDAVSRNEFLCMTGAVPGSASLLQPGHALIHGIALRADDVQYMADMGVGLVWSPRSNVALYGNTAPVVTMDHLGVSIGLGTDWLPSGSMNMLRELACAASLNDTHFGGHFEARDLWRMATFGSARALGFDTEIGALYPGYAADITVFANQGRTHHEAIVRAGLEDVALVLLGGEVLHGLEPLVQSLSDTSCDAIDVCGVAKQVCLPSGSLDSLPTLPYPLESCGVPDDEPTCDPARTLESDVVNGSTRYDGLADKQDSDGDGIDDDVDLCPTVFDPVRPVDNGAQADVDEDGVGDACDVCPLDADSEDCIPADPADLDLDGKRSWEDNCPRVPNEDQADADNDGKGDACDDCPDQPNPGAQGCSTSIYAIQDPSRPDHASEGTSVEIQCVVTAVADRLTWCQDPQGGPFSGIAIFAGDRPQTPTGEDIVIGDDVVVSGTIVEFYGLTELIDADFLRVGTTTVPAPEILTPAELASGPLAERWEGVLVQVDNVVVTDANPDTPMDFDEFAVTDGLRVDDAAYPDLDNTFKVGTTFSRIVGLQHYSFGDYKLLPRDADDLVQ